MTGAPLRLLLVEDEALIAMMAQDLVEAAGHAVVATAASLDEGYAACVRGGFDAALLDVNLNGDSSMSLASELKKCGHPFVFTTGYGASGIDAEHADVPVLTKPYAAAELEIVLAGFADQLAGASSITSSVDSNRG
jgi:DNA-binding response OmpR family regulator